MKLICYLLAVQLPGTILCARILTFLPMPARSHHRFIWPLLRELTNRGHHVTYYTPFSMDNPPQRRYKEIVIPNALAEYEDKMGLVDLANKSTVEQLLIFRYTGFIVQNKVCESDYFKELLDSDQAFDAVILESFLVQEGFAALAHRFNAVTINMIASGNAHWAFELVGNPYNPSYIVEYKVAATDRMNFAERLVNAVVSLGTLVINYFFVAGKVQKLVDDCFKYPGSETRPSIVHLLSNSSLLLVNSHLSTNYPFPVSPNVIEVGGLHIQQNKRLPQAIQTFMDGAKDGVVYFNLGSQMNTSRTLNSEIVQEFVLAFGKIRQRVLWKWEKDTFPAQLTNIKTSNWFPQVDILAHKNCKMFITHGGVHSVLEAAAFGVPLIVMPFYFDQEKNAKQVVSAGYGLKLDYNKLNTEVILTAIKEILLNSSYRQAAKRRSQLFRDRAQTPLETATYWVEYVIKHKGAPHLRPALSRMPWYKSMLLDVVALCLALIAALVVINCLMIRLMCNWLHSLTLETKLKTT